MHVGRLILTLIFEYPEGGLEKPNDRGKLQMSGMRRRIDETNTRYRRAYAAGNQDQLTRSLHPMRLRGQC